MGEGGRERERKSVCVHPCNEGPGGVVPRHLNVIGQKSRIVEGIAEDNPAVGEGGDVSAP
eukprot:COSAG03_NODE_18537_length_353_cov_0.645669_2_plen_60_part_00